MRSFSARPVIPAITSKTIAVESDPKDPIDLDGNAFHFERPGGIACTGEQDKIALGVLSALGERHDSEKIFLGPTEFSTFICPTIRETVCLSGTRPPKCEVDQFLAATAVAAGIILKGALFRLRGEIEFAVRKLVRVFFPIPALSANPPLAAFNRVQHARDLRRQIIDVEHLFLGERCDLELQVVKHAPYRFQTLPNSRDFLAFVFHEVVALAAITAVINVVYAIKHWN